MQYKIDNIMYDVLKNEHLKKKNQFLILKMNIQNQGCNWFGSIGFEDNFCTEPRISVLTH